MVYSPDYQTSPMSYDPPDPGEYGADVIEVEAESKRDAIILGVAALMKERRHTWASDNRGDGQPPWAGYKADEVCAHECHNSPDDEGDCACCGEPK